MKELKNLIKISALMLTVFLPSFANAQILDMSTDLSPLQLTDDFLRSLYYCKPYHGEKSSSYKKINVKTVYDVFGMQDDKCKLKIDGSTNTMVHITQECALTTEQAQKYADALSNYQVNKFNPRFDEQRINSNEHYQKAMEIMSNPDICTITRDKIDYTSELRANLLECEPIVSVQNILGSEITREVVGKIPHPTLFASIGNMFKRGDTKDSDEGKCHFRFKYWEPKPDISKIKPEVLAKAPEIRDVEFNYDCKWDEKTLQDYYNILDAFVIPEEQGYNFYAVDRPNSWEEMDFIIRNCAYVPYPDKKKHP